MNSFIDQFKQQIAEQGLTIVEEVDKPWGCSIRIDDDQLEKFLELYYAGAEQVKNLDPQYRYSPKFLIVAPGKQLSWQVHERRFEIWRVEVGPVGVYSSPTDQQPEQLDSYQQGQLIVIEKDVRHRLVGLDNWGVIAEIWIHTDPDNLSNEEDIRRIADDFGR